MSKLKIAFIGCGGMAGAHLSGYLELKKKGLDIFDIVAVADPVEEQTAKFVERISAVQTSHAVAQYKDYEKMLQEQKPDGVDICTPHFLHHTAAIAAFEAGAHAIVEKPLGVTIKAGRKMIDSAKEHGRIFAVAEQVRRWIGPRAVEWAIRNGLIGEPRMFFAQILSGAKIDPTNPVRDTRITWRQYKMTGGGGPTIDGGVHFADLLIYFFGDVESVYAQAGNFGHLKYRDADGNPVDGDVEDTSIASFKFKSGASGVWAWSSLGFGKSFNYTVYYGTTGSIYSETIYPTRAQLHLWDKTMKDTPEFIGEFLSSEDEATIHKYFPPELYPEPTKLGGDHGVTIEVYDFLNAIREGRPPELDGWDGLKAQAISESIYESATCGQVVKIEDVLSGRVDEFQKEINDKWQI